jgi:hypothetical protein
MGEGRVGRVSRQYTLIEQEVFGCANTLFRAAAFFSGWLSVQ